MPTSSALNRATDLARRRSTPLVLELDLADGVLPDHPHDPLARVLSARRIVLGDVLDGLRHACDDDRVAALVVHLGGARRIGLATAQEIRDAVTAFRRAGKRAVAWAETYGEFSQGSVPFYLATAFDEVWVQPSGDVGLLGVAAQATFLHDALGKLGVDVQLGQRHEYKNAANTFTRQELTPPHRESLERLVDSAYSQVVDGIAQARGLEPAAVRAAVDDAPLMAADAHERGLLDRLGYRDEVYAEVRRRVGAGAQLLFLSRYAKHAGRQSPVRRLAALPRRPQPTIALVRGTGGIRLGRSGRSPLSGASMGSDTVGAALRAAVADPSVRAIVFRVDSPGGSYVASDTVWHEVVLARRAGKPVVVSMGDVAGSGGYFVAMAADVIVAQPGTLTGSIGVFGGKPVIADLLDRLGVGTGAVAEGSQALMFSQRRRFSDDEWERVQRWLDHVYDDFVAKAAEGRRMSREAVHEVARGRVWTGADAAERGLVDQLGGLELALAVARERVGLADDAGKVRTFPKVRPIDRVRPARSSEDPAAAASLRLEAWGPLASAAARLGLPDGGPLLMAELPDLL